MTLLLATIVVSLVSLSTQQDTDYCDAALCQNGGQHIACNGLTQLAPTCGPEAEEFVLDASQQALIVDLHNQLRSRVASGRQNYSGESSFFPEAARMGTLQWDPELANISAANTRRCIFGHDGCRSTARFPSPGQNIRQMLFRGGNITVDKIVIRMIKHWYKEYKKTTLEMIARLPSEIVRPEIRRFSQMVSDRVTHLGCSLVKFKKRQWVRLNYVCNYSTGNVEYKPIYVAGKACSGCTTGCNTAYPGLCNVAEVISSKPMNTETSLDFGRNQSIQY